MVAVLALALLLGGTGVLRALGACRCAGFRLRAVAEGLALRTLARAAVAGALAAGVAALARLAAGACRAFGRGLAARDGDLDA
ncbi:MAG: hypothetical protein J0H80_21825, partial [Rhizobiales bacterium]|nr:hypothetical protein [Hyphomicrobiales bacterium]